MADDYLVVGGDSLIGEHIAREIERAGGTVRLTSRRARPGAIGLDLAQPDLDALGDGKFRAAFLCAAVTSMKACEDAPDASRQVNVEGTLAVMRRLAAAGTHLVFLSSSQVFDGETPFAEETTALRPKNEYGRQKAAVENAIADEGLPAAVLRVTKVLAARPVGMFQGWYAALRRGEPATAANNMTIAPITAEEAADAALRLAMGGLRGIWHRSSADEMSYFEAARLMARMCGLPQALVRGEDVTEAQVPTIYRHRYAAIASDKLKDALGVAPRATRDVLTELFSAYGHAGRAASH